MRMKDKKILIIFNILYAHRLFPASVNGISKQMRRKGDRENKNEQERSVCRLLQSHCTTLEFQTRTLGRGESRGVEREERQRGGGARERAAG